MGDGFAHSENLCGVKARHFLNGSFVQYDQSDTYTMESKCQLVPFRFAAVKRRDRTPGVLQIMAKPGMYIYRVLGQK